MYRVFLADEDARVRAEIRGFPLWEEEEYVLVGEAADGESALCKIRDLRPDVVITGVRMPFMDGIELTRAVHYSFPWIGVLLLNSHDDPLHGENLRGLHYAGTLFRPVSEHALKEELQRVVEDERKWRRGLPGLILGVNAAAAEEDLAKGRALSEWLKGEGTLAQEWNREPMLHRLLLMPCTDAAMRAMLAGAMRLVLMQRAGAQKILVLETPEGAVLLLSGQDSRELEKNIYDIAVILQQAGRYLDCDDPSVPILIGGCFSNMEMLRANYRALCAQIGQLPEAGRRILGPGDRLARSPRLPGEVRVLSEVLIGARPDEVEGLIGEGERYGAYDAVETAQAAAQIEREMRGEVCSEWTPQPDRAACIRQLCRALEIRDEMAPDYRVMDINRIRSLIARNFRNRGMTLAAVARHIGMAEERFSVVFAQETGITFAEYLARLRVNAAAQLLTNTRRRISGIAEVVGCGDADYFCTVFRLLEGMDPREYRKIHSEKT